MADIVTPLLSGGVGFLGALVGALSAQWAAQKTREADRKKRCVDRVLAAITHLESAYAEYTKAAVTKPDSPHVALPLEGAMRVFNQAVLLLNIEALQNEAFRYADLLRQYHLFYGQPRDPLDEKAVIPTLKGVNDKHSYLAAKLRRYERT